MPGAEDEPTAGGRRRLDGLFGCVRELGVCFEGRCDGIGELGIGSVV